MKKNISFFMLLILSAYFICASTPTPSKATELNSKKIVIFNPNIKSVTDKDSLLKKHNLTKLKDLSLINGASISGTSKDIKELERDNLVIRIDNDDIITTTGKTPSTPPAQPSQVVPWGITKIKADMTSRIASGITTKIAVMDSGIDLGHPDLKDNIMPGFNAIKAKALPNDDYGHGTHVAGIIAASNNTIGVLGTAPKASLYPVKVLDSAGSGYLSDLIEGLDWCISNKMQVVNMSFELVDSQSLHTAIKKVYDTGIVMVASIGNNPTGSVAYPAAYPEVIAVSAVDSNNNIADFCPKGKVDICAPGVNIYSTYKSSGYINFSGTSMAAPYVTGVISLLLSSPVKYDLNQDGIYSPDEIKSRLESTSLDLGSVGKDTTYGSGLVDAYSALTR